MARPSRPMGRLGAAFDRLRQHKVWNPALRACAVLGIIGMQWLQLELGCLAFEDLHFLRPEMLPVNLLMMALPSLLLAVFFKKWWTAFAVTSPLVFVLAVINYFVTRWHGSPLVYALLSSAPTAARVLDQYIASLTPKMLLKVLLLFGILVVCIAGALLLRWLGSGVSQASAPGGRLKTVAFRLVFFLVAVLLAWLALFSPVALKPAHIISKFVWRTPVCQYGYLPYVVDHFLHSLKGAVEPDGYDVRLLEEFCAGKEQAGADLVPETLPDIILILNETFYDLGLYTEFTADKPYLEQISSLDNAVRGYAVVPTAGGGTNDSEYELMTSNSNRMLNGPAPFTYLDLAGANSIVRYAAALGYRSTAMHPCPPYNYNRNVAYPILGFDECVFAEDFSGIQDIGNDYLTDASCYQDLQRLYQPDSGQPRLFYLLTIQNHGPYPLWDPSQITVHVEDELGGLTDKVSEHLSRIALSDAAFADLTLYFEEVDRPVIICMVGDHAPSFINDLPARPGLSEEERSVYSRATPFVIWANFPIESKEVGIVSMTDLVPMLLQTAGMPLSPYYQSILELQKEFPVRTNNGIWQNAQGEWGSCTEDEENCPDLLQWYYFMEYNNLTKKERIQELFDPPL